MAFELGGGALLRAALQFTFEGILSCLRKKSKIPDFDDLLSKLRNSVSILLSKHEQISRNRAVEAWLDDLQDPAFDAEDLIDDIKYVVLQLKAEADSKPISSKVRNLLKHWKKFRNLFSKSHDSNDQDLEKRMRKILERLEFIVKQKDVLALKERVGERPDFNDCAHISPNWLSKLDGCCLQRTVQQITCFKDFVAFSEVCHSTRDVCSNMEWDGGPKPPCLVLSEKPGCSSRPFFSPHNRNVFVLDLPAAVGRCIWGSQHGWLVTVGPKLDAQLMNPISQVCVNLPPLPTMQNQLARGNRYHMVQNLFVVKTKIHPMEFLVIAILNPGDRLVFTRRPGDVREWAFVSNPKKFFFRSVAYFEDQLYALCNNGSLIWIDFNGSIVAKAEFVAPHPIQEYVGYQPHHEKTGRAYLAPLQDDLFGVFRYSCKDIAFERTVQFFVYNFDFGSLEWKPEQSIGDKAFFVGRGNSWGISHADTVNCSSNSIYYSDDTESGLGLDNGIYDLETMQTELLGFGANVPSSQPLATWITPSLTPSTFR
ncbi:hypothetical protein TIFTF001_047449 [Ficus carica]|uniref:DUF295 domain-containing protein n=1 Tax=Ficus carica TaxID=3494 RepID=A0AA87ZAI2_FICCA|nr:hypothetical protein TIFTF001_047449 [Ficus carica]